MFRRFRSEAAVERKQVAQSNLCERLLQVVRFVRCVEQVFYVDVEYRRQNFLPGQVSVRIALMLVCEAFDAERFAYRHRQRVIKQIAQSSVVEVFRDPDRACLDFILYSPDCHVRQFREQVFIQTRDRVNLVGFFFRVVASHLACIIARVFKNRVVDRHKNRSCFHFQDFFHHHIRLRRDYVDSADQVQQITRFKAIYLIKYFGTCVAVAVVPLISLAVRFLSVTFRAVDKEVAD